MSEEQFKEWLKREMPEGTVIGNPEWWAKKIWQAALSAKSVPEADEATTELRVVYEAARKFLRYNGVDKDKVNQAVDELDEAIEAVKHIDGGFKDFPLEAAPQAPTDDERVRESCLRCSRVLYDHMKQYPDDDMGDTDLLEIIEYVLKEGTK